MVNDNFIYGILALAVFIAVIALVSLVLHILANRDSKSTRSQVDEHLRLGRCEAQDSAKALREEISSGLKGTNDTLFNTLDGLGRTLYGQLDGMTKQIKELQEANQNKLDEIRKENAEGMKAANESIARILAELGKEQKEQLDGLATQLKVLAESNQSSLDRIRNTFDERVKELQESNEKKLEEMRKTVDEKLHDTLEKRLGESFKLVSERLDTVHQGLGEMQALASGVGDLKRVLTNVKARGTWAEVQLGALPEQVLTTAQFEKNVMVKPDSGERVEYAIRLPGPNDDPTINVWLPIDSKFPQEDYIRIQDAADSGNPELVQTAVDALSKTIRNAAKDICGKYVCPPHTTDFAIMFLATEGLHAEVLRQPVLVDELQRNHRIILAGPTTLSAILSSLRMGFQTLAIEQRASEVWQVLGAVKTEFGKFGDVLAKVKRQLNTASKTIDATEVRSRAMEKRLRSVEEMPKMQAAEVLALATGDIVSDWDQLATDAEESETNEGGLFDTIDN